ncbi:MAG: hypothetical protein E7516_05815 [Ruminococcaceae bacterium]|nr:hypothetical protein [Oscillospiraceae bacterium]
MKFIEKPNLPKGKVTLAAISEEAGESIKKLNSLGIEILEIKKNSKLPEPVCSHADIQILHMGNNCIFCYEHLFLGEFEEKFNFTDIHEKAGNKYPDDVRLNCTIIGNKLICNPKTVSRKILEYADSCGLTVINVNQGYSRCSICVVNENTIITDDRSIFAAAGNFFNDTQFISKGSIGLNGYGYGFIGGCCGKIDKNKIAFNGAIESHNDYKVIIDCLERNNTECIELNRNRLYDIGGIIPICEAL